MKAIVIADYGGRDQLKEAELPRPKLEANDVLIEVHAAAINPVDWKIRAGYLKSMLTYSFPLILGWDVAGIIRAVGPDVKQFSVGDEVFSRPDIARNGAYAEYIAVEERLLAKKPANLSFVEAASIPLAGLTAWQCLVDFAKIQKGDKVLVHAGAGGVGSLAIQLVKALGAHVATTVSGKNVDFVKSLGADVVINYELEDFSTVLAGYDIVLDTMGGEIQTKSYAILAKGGRLVSIVNPPDAAVAEAHGVMAGFLFLDPDGAQLQMLAKLLEEGSVKAIVAETFPLTVDGVKAAHQASETHHTKGKLVLKVR